MTEPFIGKIWHSPSKLKTGIEMSLDLLHCRETLEVTFADQELFMMNTPTQGAYIYKLWSLLNIQLRAVLIRKKYSKEVMDQAERFLYDWVFSQDFLQQLENVGYSWKSNQEVAKPYSDTGMELSLLAKALPGVNTLVKYPCKCLTHEGTNKLFSIIMHLNDYGGWTREAIADWIESLDIDINFKPKEEIKELK